MNIGYRYKLYFLNSKVFELHNCLCAKDTSLILSIIGTHIKYKRYEIFYLVPTYL